VIARDDYKCVISGFVDYAKYKDSERDVVFLLAVHPHSEEGSWSLCNSNR